MRKIWILTFLLVSVLFLGTPAMAEEYVSRDFPSNEIILKNFEVKGFGDPQIFGKTGGNNLFEVYFKGDHRFVIKCDLIRLDTNRWILRVGSELKILQK